MNFSMKNISAQDYSLVISILHVFVAIPLVLLAINPSKIPMRIPVNAVIYAVYFLLGVAFGKHMYNIFKDITMRIEMKKAHEMEEQTAKVLENAVTEATK